MKVKDHLAGRLGVCPTCGSRFRLPDISSAQPPRQAAPIGPIPAVPTSAPLPVAEPIPIDPAVVSSLPIAVPSTGPNPPIDAVPPFSTPSTAWPTAVTFGQGPLETVSISPTGPVGVGTVPKAPPPDGPWSSPIDPPEGHSPVDPILDWTSSPRSSGVSRKKPRNDGGMGLSLALVAIALLAAALAWMILRSRGIG